MTTQTLRRVTLETLKNYSTAARRAVVAYRSGGHRLMHALNSALENGVYPRTAKLAPRATGRISEVRGNVSDIVVKGIDLVSRRTEKAIELGSTTAAAQVTKLAEFAAGIDNQYVANGLQAAARLTMPGAKVALVVSSKVAEGANALADAAGARVVRKAVAGAQRKAGPVTRKAKSTVKPTVKRSTRRAASVVKAVKAPVAKAARAAKKAAA